jgi:protein-L-isoaspartate(D-aspartate) O-methyltransferase
LGYSLACFFGDGFLGLPQFAPFDRIIVTAGAVEMPENLVNQLKNGGKMVVPVGSESHQEMLLVTRISESKYEIEKHGGFVFVPMLKGTVKNG